MKDKEIETKNLISKTYKLENFVEAFEESKKIENLGILIKYKSTNKNKIFSDTFSNLNYIEKFSAKQNNNNFGFIGAGNYAQKVLMPIFKKTIAILKQLHHQKVSGHLKLQINFYLRNIQKII